MGLARYLAATRRTATLDLTGWAIGDSALKLLAGQKQLRDLTLTGTRVSDEGLNGLEKLTQLQRLYEIILGTDLDKRNFRKKILSLDLLVETDEVEQGVRHRAARLYRFDRRKYDRLAKQGFELSI